MLMFVVAVGNVGWMLLLGAAVAMGKNLSWVDAWLRRLARRCRHGRC